MSIFSAKYFSKRRFYIDSVQGLDSVNTYVQEQFYIYKLQPLVKWDVHWHDVTYLAL